MSSLKDSNGQFKNMTTSGSNVNVHPESYLFAFDFDHTVVNDNSDTFITSLAKCPIPAEVKAVYDGTNWPEYMNKIFQFLHEEGVTIEDICRCIHRMEPTPGMIQLLTALVRLKTVSTTTPSSTITGTATASNNDDLSCSTTSNRPTSPQIHLLIISDANDLFISEYLNTRVLKPSNQNGSLTAFQQQQPTFPFDIITNKASVDSSSSSNNGPATNNNDGAPFSITPFEKQTSCEICPKNLCKGSAILKYMEEKGPFTRVFYSGDGTNDICPSLKLNQHDVVFARKNYKMYKKLLKSADGNLGITAKIVYWEDANIIQSTISEYIQLQ